jgi:hypothetical protein
LPHKTSYGLSILESREYKLNMQLEGEPELTALITCILASLRSITELPPRVAADGHDDDRTIERNTTTRFFTEYFIRLAAFVLKVLMTWDY